MKKKLMAVAAMGACIAPAAVLAQQSSVVVYGVIDAAVLYQTHADSTGHSVAGLQQGGEGFLSGSRFGLKGDESLGGDLKAGFVLENGFVVDTGGLDQQKQLFGRQSYVKLGNSYGEIALGRQYTTANTMAYYVDALGVGAAPSNSWFVYLTGQRYDNALSYTGNFGKLNLIAEYALGESAGHASQRSSMSFGIKYDMGPALVVGDYQQTNDSLSRSARIYMAGLKATAGAANFYANYIHSQRDAGFDVTNGGTDTASITSMSTPVSSSSAAALNSVFVGSRQDNFLSLGLVYNLTPVVSLTAATMAAKTSAGNFSGTRWTTYGVGDYAFSKRTDAYLALAFDRVSGDWSGLLGNSTTSYSGGSGKALNGNNNQLSFMLGLRHKF